MIFDKQQTVCFTQLPKRDLRSLEKATNEALKSDFKWNSKRLGAYCPNEDTSGHNQYRRTMYKVGERNIIHSSLHAEVACIRKCKSKPKVLYVVRIMSNINNYGNAKPCEMCQHLMMEAGIKTVKYTDWQNERNVLVTMKLIENPISNIDFAQKRQTITPSNYKDKITIHKNSVYGASDADTTCSSEAD